MTSTSDLLAAIVADLDDDTPRLRYADWLEETGDDNGAELVRVQCELAQLVPEDWRWPALAARAAELAPKGESGVTFRRGLPSHYEAYAVELLRRNRAALRERFPAIDSVTLHGAGGRIAELLDSGILDGLRELTLDACGTTDDEVALLAASPRLATLRSLSLIHVHATNVDNWRALVCSPHLGRLTSFAADSCEAGVAVIGAAATWPELRRLRLTDKGLTAQHLERIADSPIADHLELLALESAELGEPGARAIAGSTRLRSLRWLALRNCDLDDAALASLASAPALDSVEFLGLEDYKIRPAGAAALAGSPHLGNLARLSARRWARGALGELVRSNTLGALAYVDASESSVADDDLRALAAGPLAAHLLQLRLERNRAITSAGAEAIAASTSNLRELDLGHCSIDADGSEALAWSPDLEALERVTLTYNKIGERGGRAWMKSPYADQLVRLELHKCHLPRSVQAKLRGRFGNRVHL